MQSKAKSNKKVQGSKKSNEKVNMRKSTQSKKKESIKKSNQNPAKKMQADKKSAGRPKSSGAQVKEKKSKTPLNEKATEAHQKVQKSKQIRKSKNDK